MVSDEAGGRVKQGKRVRVSRQTRPAGSWRVKGEMWAAGVLSTGGWRRRAQEVAGSALVRQSLQ